ncbi:hypothetical protein [Sandarakinorhabdus sp. DWP1-3-1]|uniref:hypothetical protein n=1 Tax=Sandarakinorhabdus sp. DWP1-3-1 TaxID=2804627 RepID=UPI003CFA38A6
MTVRPKKPKAVAAAKRPPRAPAWRKFDPRLYDSPDGHMADFGFGILKASSQGVSNSAFGYVRSKLRQEEGPLTAATFGRDVAANAFIVSPGCPDLLAKAEVFWPLVDSDVWKPDQHLAVAITLWFPGVVFQHRAVRAASEFAQARLADARGLCVQLVAHSPARISHGGDFHVHLVASARVAGADGVGVFARDLLGHGGQTLLHSEWQNFLADLPPSVRP